MNPSKISLFISFLLKIMLLFGIICIFFIPELYDEFSGILPNTFHDQTIPYKIAFYFCVFGLLSILFFLIKLFQEIYKGTPFKKEIEIDLKTIAVLFMIVFIIITIKIIFIPSVLSIAVSFITFLASLSFYVLSQIIKVAIEYKKEIDYTV